MKSLKLLAALLIIAATTKGQKTANLQVGPFTKIKVTSIATVYVRIDPIQYQVWTKLTSTAKQMSIASQRSKPITLN